MIHLPLLSVSAFISWPETGGGKDISQSQQDKESIAWVHKIDLSVSENIFPYNDLNRLVGVVGWPLSNFNLHVDRLCGFSHANLAIH